MKYLGTCGVLLFFMSSQYPMTAAAEDNVPKNSQTGDEDLGLIEVTPGPSITLAECLRRADRRNVTIEAARLEIAKTEAQLKQAWALVLPGVQATLVETHLDHEESFNFGDSLPPSLMGAVGDMPDTVLMPQDDLKGTVQAGMALINAQSWYTIAAAKKGVRAAELAVEDGRQQLLLGVAQAYFASMMTGSLIELREEQLRSAAHHREVARARHEAGSGLKIDVVRAETDMEQARQELLNAHMSYDNMRDTLRVLIGMKEDLPIPVETRNIVSPGEDEGALVKRGLEARSDILAKQAIVAVMEKQLDAAWMQFVPTLDAGWQFSYQFTEPGDMGSEDRSRWAMVFTLTVPIYNHFRYGDLDYKRAQLRQAMLYQEEATDNVQLEVKKTRRNYLTALSAVEIAERQAALANEAMTLVDASYIAGTSSSLDITDARRTVSAAKVNVIATRLQAQIALLSLLRAIGEDMTIVGQ